MTSVLSLRNATKEFRGVAAIKNINFDLRPGEIHAIAGENGAGKSTLTKILAGVYKLSSGEMQLDGKDVVFSTPADALKAGIGMVFQETNLVPALTVAQNLFLGEERWFNRLRGLYIEAQQFLAGMNMQVDPTAVVSDLGAAKRQMVEVARAVRHKARVIIFDEPTASFTPEEKGYFYGLVQRLVKSGVSIIFISHALEEALELADRITVLRDGELIVTDDARNFDRDRIVQAMVGRTVDQSIHGTKRSARPYGAKVLSVQGISMGQQVRGASFSVYAGQVTGLFGLVGAGRTEIVKILSGVYKRDLFHGGEVVLEGERVRFRTPREAVRKGITYVTEDRKLEGFFDTQSIADNIYIGEVVAGKNLLGGVSRQRSLEVAEEWIKKLSIRAIDPNSRIVELSGGNQQKVVIGKSLIQKPKIVIFDEPTRGVDIGAIVEIHKLINSLADQGIAVIVVSSYLPEIMSLSDRVLVTRAGRIVEEFDAAGMTSESIMFAAVH